MASPYDALLEPPTQSSPYDALLTQPKESSPYDAFLNTSPPSEQATKTAIPEVDEYAGFRAFMGAQDIQNQGTVGVNVPATISENASGAQIMKDIFLGDKSVLDHSLPRPDGDSVGAGITRAVESAAEGLVSPRNAMLMATLAGAPALIQKAAAGAFGVMAAKQVPAQVKAAIDSDSPGQTAENATGAVINTIFAGLGAKGVLGDGLVAPESDVSLPPGGPKTEVAGNEIALSDKGDMTINRKPVSTTAQAEEAAAAPVAPPETPVGKITQILEQRQKTSDPTERQKLWDQAQELLKNEQQSTSFIEQSTQDKNTGGNELVQNDPKTDNKEIKLGLERDSVRDRSLESITEPEFDRQRMQINKTLDAAEYAWDQNPNLMTNQDRQNLADLQDKYDAYHNEKFRRDTSDLSPEDLWFHIRDEIQKLPQDPNKSKPYESGIVKLNILFDNMENNGYSATDLSRGMADAIGRLASSEDYKEVLSSDFGRAAAYFKHFKEEENSPDSNSGKFLTDSTESSQNNADPYVATMKKASDESGAIQFPSLDDVSAPAKGIIESIKGEIGTMEGRTFPKTTLADRPLGELGARWISSRIAAPHLSNVFATNVLEGTGLDPKDFGAALTEDNLRSIRQGYLDAGEMDKAMNVGTLVGQKNSPFKTEEDLQAYLHHPAVETALARHKQLWNETVEPMYKQAMMIDPDETLPERGAQTGARVNLHIAPEDSVPANRISSVGQGNLMGTMRKKSPFGRQATGTGVYDTNYFNMMENTFGRQLEIANKNAFENRMVETGNAVIDKPGQAGTLTLKDGGEVTEFPLKRQTVVVEGQPISQNQSLYVRKSLAGEYRRGSNTESPIVPELVSKASTLLNKSALAGLTDATVHVSNLATALFNRPGENPLLDSLLSATGRADIPVTLTKAVMKGMQDNRSQLAELAEIGALREKHPPSWNPLANFIGTADRVARLTLDDTFKSLAEKGIVEDTETNRREFVNQVGQYNKRAQGNLMRVARDTGIGPFATAGRTFNVLGARTATLSPGVKAAHLSAALALRANVAAKWVGLMTLVGTANYLLTKDKGGGVMGRPGVKVGYIDTGKDDDNGRPQTINAIDLIGLGRGLRVTGVHGYMEAKRNGLPDALARDSAYRDMVNSAVSPFAGPVVRFGMGIGNMSPAVEVAKPFPVVPPGKSQIESNVKNAALEANPIVASINDAMKPGGKASDAIKRQLPRFTLSPGKPAQMMAKYPEIVRMAQAGSFVDDVIGRARKMAPADRIPYLKDSIQQLDPKDRQHALLEMRRRRVLP